MFFRQPHRAVEELGGSTEDVNSRLSKKQRSTIGERFLP